MVNSNTLRAGYGVQPDKQDRTQGMSSAQDAIVAADAADSSTKSYDASRIVEELVCRYLHCSTTTSGIFRF